MATWLTPDEAKTLWRDAAGMSDDVLSLYLSAAQNAVIAYAPALDPLDTEPLDPEDAESPEVQTVPEAYRLGQYLQARNVWNSGKASPSGDFDGSSYGLSTFPLDWQVRQLLRPKRAVPVIA